MWPAFVMLMLAIALIGTTLATHLNAANQHAHQIIAQRIFRPAVDDAIVDAITIANAAANANGGPLSGPFQAQTFTHPPCGDANATGLYCNGLVTINLVWTGQVNGPNATETLGNVNTAVTDSGAKLESYAPFAATISLRSARNAQIAQTLVTGTLRIQNTPPNFASLDGTLRVAGNVIGLAAEGHAGGKCDTTQPNCSAAALDQGSTDNAVADDGRLHAQLKCYDPNWIGNGGPNPGNRCAPTGNTAATPQPHDQFADQRTTNTNGSGTSYTR